MVIDFGGFHAAVPQQVLNDVNVATVEALGVQLYQHLVGGESAQQEGHTKQVAVSEA